MVSESPWVSTVSEDCWLEGVWGFLSGEVAWWSVSTAKTVSMISVGASSVLNLSLSHCPSLLWDSETGAMLQIIFKRPACNLALEDSFPRAL